MTEPTNLARDLDTPLQLTDGPAPRRVRPLQAVMLPRAEGRWVVTDARRRVYVDQSAVGGVRFRVAGATGWHDARLLDESGQTLRSHAFGVACETRIDDGDHGFGRLLGGLQFTMLAAASGDGLGSVRLNGKLYRYFIRWLRDHTHALKGMKYFSGELRTGLELYADTQREDGMLFERIALRAPVQGWRDHTFAPGGFVRMLEADTAISYTLQRIPVENDVEFLFIECLYRTWQATGDTRWMTQYLDHAERAVAYSTSDRYRWSEKFKLLKRGYTIDTWDFLHADDSKLTMGDNVCDPDTTTFGVMHGDNTGMAKACRMLAEMLRVVGRPEDAQWYARLADDLLDRLAETAWDDRGYYRHHVSEDPSLPRDVGDTDESAQVSLSNAYALNRGIGQDKARAILQTYQRIRSEMPDASPGEFYNLYPPFDTGFTHNCARWHYMNGGVSMIVAGELARGAFAHGMPEYGADILQRVRALAERHGGRLHVCFHGNPEHQPPERTFTPLRLGNAARITAAHRPATEEGAGWEEAGNDLSQIPTGEVEFLGIPFRLDAQGLGVGVASNKSGYHAEARIAVGGKHQSLYLLHTASNAGHPTAEIVLEYEDGSTARKYLVPNQQLEGWFMPGAQEVYALTHPKRTRKGWPEYQLAWRGGNERFDNVGLFIWGWDNPEPDKPIRELVARAIDNGSVYFLPAVTACDHPVWFPPSEVSHGIPDSWGAAAVVYALIEGLAGVVDGSQAFEHAQLAPQWHTAGVDAADVQITYPASGGYVAYRYRYEPADHTVELIVALGGEQAELTLPLPGALAEGSQIDVLLNGEVYSAQDHGSDHDPKIRLEGPGPHHIQIKQA